MNNEPKVSQNRQKKEGIVAQLNEKVAKSKAMVFTNYQGITHQQLEQFKKELKTVDAEFVATKNSLLKIALKDNNVTADEAQFINPTGTLFAYGDAIAPLKALAKKMKELGMPRVKFGLLEGEMLDEAQVKKLATLPTKEVLYEQLVGMLKSPIFDLHHALNWNIQKFVMTLNAVASTKPSA